jgi:hypothetical protein
MGRKKQKKNKQKKKKNGGVGPNGSFGGRITVGIRPAWKKTGRLEQPRSGAELTVRQTVAGSSFAVHTGLTAGTNNIDLLATGGFPLALGFTLNDMPQSASWAAVFDQYRFEEIEIHLLPYYNNQTPQTVFKDVSGASHFVLDFDDTSSLATENAALEYDNVQTAMVYDAISIKFRPAVAPAYYQSGAFSGYGVEPSDRNWLDCASLSIRHYGVKGWISTFSPTSTSIAGWVVYGQYTVSFRNTR